MTVQTKFILGDTQIGVFNVGDFPLTMEGVFGPEADLSRYFEPAALAGPTYHPSNSFFVSSGDIKVIIDPGDTARLSALWQIPLSPEHPLPAPLLDQLAKVEVRPSEVTHVVITHLHFDHFMGVTTIREGRPELAFPEAKHLIPKKDWETTEIAEARRQKDKGWVETLGIVEEAGKVELLESERNLGDGISIEPSVGESPGHQIVSVKSQGKHCYFVGDLYHMKEEVEHPELTATWADKASLLKGREEFASRASAEDALILPGHMSPGRISVKDGKPVWDAT